MCSRSTLRNTWHGEIVIAGSSVKESNEVSGGRAAPGDVLHENGCNLIRKVQAES